ncbi:hypothetical protein FRB94_005389, partial [Tulasnella sp. JGI-2019a]
MDSPSPSDSLPSDNSRSVPLAECYIDRLNDDLLHEVIAYTTAEENAEEDIKQWDYRRGGKTKGIFTRCDHFPEYATLLSRRWNVIAISSPAIWTRIRIDGKHLPSRLKLWLDRAAQAPLDVRWSYVNAENYISAADEWEGLRDLEEYTALLLSHLDQIAHLSIDFDQTGTRDLPEVLRLTFSAIARSPHLQSLDLHRFIQCKFCRQLNLTVDAFPNLRILTVDDSSIPWKSLKNLKRLELGWIYSERNMNDGTEPSWEELQDLLASSPDLEEISLKHVDDFQGPYSMTSMQLPVFHHLHTLRFNAAGELCRLLLPSLRAPNLITVTFRFNATDGPLTTPICFPNTLRSLKIASLNHVHDPLVFFLQSGLRHLVSLALERDHDNRGRFTVDLVEATMCCERLGHLDLWRVDVDGELIEDLARRRVEQNMPLESICFRDPVSPVLVNRLVHLRVKVIQIPMEEDMPDRLGYLLSGEGHD